MTIDTMAPRKGVLIVLLATAMALAGTAITGALSTSARPAHAAGASAQLAGDPDSGGE